MTHLTRKVVVMSNEEPDSISSHPISETLERSAFFRSGRAILPNIVENAAVLPLGEPSSDDCYTTLLHNPVHVQDVSVSERSGKRSRGCVLAGRGHLSGPLMKVG
jgi:hypothetical protein